MIGFLSSVAPLSADATALMKGFIDRVFLPGKTFKFGKGGVWEKLLKGKTARVITTMNFPRWYDGLVYRSAGLNVMKHAILGFCGVKPVKVTVISNQHTLKDRQRAE